MTWIILFGVLGLILISFEIIIPGGIIGAIGLVCTLAACGFCFGEFGSLGGVIGTACILVVTGALIWLEFKFVAKTSIGKRAFLTKSVDSVSSSYGDEAQALIGKAAEAMTTLSPSGYITIDGKRYEAFCQSGLIEAGTELKVIGADNFRLIVATSAATDASQA